MLHFDLPISRDLYVFCVALTSPTMDTTITYKHRYDIIKFSSFVFCFDLTYPSSAASSGLMTKGATEATRAKTKA